MKEISKTNICSTHPSCSIFARLWGQNTLDKTLFLTFPILLYKELYN